MERVNSRESSVFLVRGKRTMSAHVLRRATKVRLNVP